MFYHHVRSEILLAYVSAQVSKANSILDYVLIDWQASGLLKPSFVRPKIAAIEPSLIVHRVGNLSSRGLLEVDRRLRQAIGLAETTLADIVTELDWDAQPAEILQAMAEKTLTTLVSLAASHSSEVDLKQLEAVLKRS